MFVWKLKYAMQNVRIENLRNHNEETSPFFGEVSLIHNIYDQIRTER